jgi:hypothetical protein
MNCPGAYESAATQIGRWRPAGLLSILWMPTKFQYGRQDEQAPAIDLAEVVSDISANFSSDRSRRARLSQTSASHFGSAATAAS